MPPAERWQGPRTRTPIFAAAPAQPRLRFNPQKMRPASADDARHFGDSGKASCPFCRVPSRRQTGPKSASVTRVAKREQAARPSGSDENSSPASSSDIDADMTRIRARDEITDQVPPDSTPKIRSVFGGLKPQDFATKKGPPPRSEK